jgi:hypothetical protein
MTGKTENWIKRYKKNNKKKKEGKFNFLSIDLIF